MFWRSAGRQRAGPEERLLRITLLNVDYVTSFELPACLPDTATDAALCVKNGTSARKMWCSTIKRFGCDVRIVPANSY